MQGSRSIAVVGMACIFPGAPDVTSYWQNVCAGVDAISTPLPERIDPIFHDPHAQRIDRFTCFRGGFIDAHALFDPIKHGMMPIAVRSAEPEQLLSLEVAAAALDDAGYGRSARAPRRTAVLLGRGNYASSARSRFEQSIRGAEQLVMVLRQLMPHLAEAEVERVRRQFQERLAPPEREAVVNLVPNLAAARIAERFDFVGPAYTIDAACASSLVAVDQACSALRFEEVDLALAGGVHLCHSEDFWGVFQQVGLLSPSGKGRPLDRRADGLLIGEGVGFVVLKREEDALRDGDRIYAAIAGTGVSSDGRGTSVVRPSREGQTLALARAWQASGREPGELQLLEAHATGTQIGDATEIETAAGFFGLSNREPATIGSVKSMIGHTMPAAGVAGLIKTALAVHHGVLPPTLNCEEPRNELRAAGFVARSAAHPWRDAKRTAAVNAFGFGGSNAHVVLVSRTAPARPPAARHASSMPATPNVARYAAATLEGLIEAVREDRQDGDGPVRAAAIEPTAERRERLLQLMRAGRAVHGRFDLFFSARALLREGGGRVVCLFPGFDGGELPSLDALARWLGVEVEPKDEIASLEARGRAILSANRLMLRGLAQLRLGIDMFAGHSVGEWSAMEAAGVLDRSDLDRMADALNPGSVGDGDAVFIALGAPAARAQEIIAGTTDAVISHDNCPHQSVVACRSARAGELMTRFGAHGVLAQRMPFGSGVHSRFFAPHLARSMAMLEGLTLRPWTTPVYSATSAALYPTEAGAIRDVIARHMIEPVRFRELVERLYADGARMFVQAGAGPLTGFVTDTLRDRAHVAIGAHQHNTAPLHQLVRVACAAWVEGAQINLASPKHVVAHSAAAQRLQLGVPLVRLEGALGEPSANVAASSATTPSSALNSALRDNCARIMSVQAEVVAALQGRGPISSPHTTTPEPPSVVHRPFSLEGYPELVDHCFYRQASDWHDMRDCSPVMPMTGLLELLARAAQASRADQRVTGLRDVWAKRWMNLSSPLEVAIKLNPTSPGSIGTEIGELAQGTVELARDLDPPARYEPFELRARRPSPVDAAQLYADRWMFHGPRYQSVAAIEALGDDGIEGQIKHAGGIGSLLDGAGQLLGLWVMLMEEHDRFAMPLRIRRLRYLREPPSEAQALHCSVRIREIGATRVVADMRIGCAGALWIEIEGWEDRRFPTDERLWRLIRWPEHTLLCDMRGPSAALPLKRYQAANTFDMLAGRYLTHDEREQLGHVDARKRWPALVSLIAAKDAMRARYRACAEAVFPAELSLATSDGVHYAVRRRERVVGQVRVSIDDNEACATLVEAQLTARA